VDVHGGCLRRQDRAGARPETGRWVRTGRFETNFTDASGTGRLLGQVAGRTGKTVTSRLDSRGQDWKNKVAFVAIDPCAVYRSAVERALPHAVIVVDHFHLVRLARRARERLTTLFALADVRLKPGPATALLEHTTFFFSSKGMLLTSPLPGDMHRVVASVPDRSKAPTAEETEALLATRGPRGGGLKIAEVITASTYHVQERAADKLSDGPVFLLGDAAHTRSTAGGQGMNTGIQDAGNLAWKLHAVLTGLAPEDLLDTFHGERHPVTVGLVGFTSQITGLATMRDPELCQRRNDAIAAAAGAPGITDWLVRRLSELDISYSAEPPDGTCHVGQRVSPTLVPAAGLDWTLALPNPLRTTTTTPTLEWPPASSRGNQRLSGGCWAQGRVTGKPPRSTGSGEAG
jgi:hypothetical protein